MNLQTSCVQLVRADRHCQPPEQHFRVQGLQEQNPDISGRHMETTLFFLKMPTWFWLLILRWSFLMPPSCSSRSWCRWTLLQGSWSSDLLVNSVEWTKQFATHWPTEPIKQCEAHVLFLVALPISTSFACLTSVVCQTCFNTNLPDMKNEVVDASHCHLLLRPIVSAYVT